MTDDQRNGILSLLHNAMQHLEWLPCGGIGPDGASEEELNAEASKGQNYAGDAVYHQSQLAWLHLKKAVDQLTSLPSPQQKMK